MKRFTYFLLPATLLAISSLWSGVGAETLTVAESTSTNNHFVPIYGNYDDDYQHVQVLYPSSMLSDMNGKQISSIAFHLKTTATKAFKSTYAIKLEEVANTSVPTSYIATSSSAKYTGLLDARGTTMVISFTPFTYNGGNLLFDLTTTSVVSNGYSDTFFYGVNQDANLSTRANSSSSVPSSGTAAYFLPMTTFTYEAAENPNCHKPTDLTKGTITASSASFTWSAGSDSESEWQYICLPAETTVDWTSASVTTTNSASATIEGLTAATDYNFYVRASCSASEKSSEVSSSFKTRCAGISTYSTGFESSDCAVGSLPNCWSAIGGSPAAYNYYYNDGAQALRFTGKDVQYAILPPFSTSVKSLAISFWHRTWSDYFTGDSYAKLEIGYMTDPEDASTFASVLSSLSQSSTYSQTEDLAFSGAPNNAYYIAIKYTGSSSASDYCLIDDISVSAASACAKPTGLSAEAASATSASVSWIAGGSEASWNLQYSTDQSSWTAVNGVTDNPYTLTGLSANTTYYVQVQADCSGSQSGWTSSAEVTTPCAAVTGVGWSQNFNDETAGSGEIPACWKKIGSSYPYVSSSSYYRRGSSGNCLYFYGGRSTSEQIAILPEFTEIANESKTLQITLWYSNYSSTYTGSSYASPEIGYITDPTDASTFEAIETLAKVSSYTEATVELPSVPAGACVAIRYGGGSSDGYLCVDDISVSEAPSCLKPTGVAGSATAYNQASISWTENGSASAWKLQYSSDNGENWSDEIAVTTNPYTLTDLSSNTLYVVRVKANCGGSTSAWSAKSAAFMTPCGLADGSNYTMGFETSEGVTDGTGKLPGCWEYLDPAATNPYVYNSSSSAYEGSNSLYFYGGTSSTVRTVILPEMNRDINTLSIEFYYKSPKSDYSTYPRFTLGYIAADGTTFEQIETLDYASDDTHYKKALTSAADDASRIAIRYSGSSSSSASAYIDNIHVFVTPSCIEPTAITASNITANSAEISWTAGGSETVWKLQYSTDGSNWTNANSGNDITTNPYTLSGLSANTTYYARVKAVCNSSDVSEWSSASAAFKTACAAEALPFSEDFGSAITCWKMEDCASNTGINSEAFKFAYPDYPQYLITPELEVSTRPVVVEFSYKAYMSTYAETFAVGYSTTTRDVSAFTFGTETNCTNTSYETYSETLPAGTKFVAIKYNSNDKYYLYIDDFSVDVAPTCPKPTTVTVSSVTAHTSSVSWTNGGSETAWKLQTSTDGTNWGAEIAANTNPFTLTGLDANATYYVRVKADCGGGDLSAWSNASAAFNTPCDANALGWGEGFEDGNLPGCWKETHSGSYGWSVSNEKKHTGSYAIRFYSRSSSGSATLEAPVVSVTANAVLEYLHFKANDATVSASVQIWVNGVLKRTKSISAVYNQWNKDTVQLFGSDYVGKEVAIKFVGTSNGSSRYLYLDDIRVLPNVTLADNVDNTATLAGLNGQTVYATIGRTIYCDGDYNTLCLPFSLSSLDGTPLEGGELYAFKYAVIEPNELQVRIYEKEDGLQAGVPYLFKMSANENITGATFENVTISASVGKSIGANEPVEFIGIFAPQAFTADDQSTLFVAAENRLAWASTNSSLKAFRAYFKRTTGAGAPLRKGMRARIVVQNEVATGADNVQSAVPCMKVLENGQLIIIRDGVKYNVQGQKIQ